MHDAESARQADLAEWIKDSAFKSDAGPTVFYHGTDITDPFNVFCRADEASIGFHFGCAEVANDRIRIIHRMDKGHARLGQIIPVVCRARAPLQLRDHFMWDQDSVASELAELGLLNDEQVDAIVDACDEAYLFAAIEMAGFDCVIYANECEYKDESTISLLIWRAELIKSPFAISFDSADPRLMPQLKTDEADLRAWRAMSERIEDAKAELVLLATRVPAP